MFLELSQLDIQYPGRSTPAVRGVSLGLRAGDIGVLIGPSGCGKTTLLRAVAGLEPVAGGSILLLHDGHAQRSANGQAVLLDVLLAVEVAVGVDVAVLEDDCVWEDVAVEVDVAWIRFAIISSCR